MPRLSSGERKRIARNEGPGEKRIRVKVTSGDRNNPVHFATVRRDLGTSNVLAVPGDRLKVAIEEGDTLWALNPGDANSEAVLSTVGGDA